MVNQPWSTNADEARQMRLLLWLADRTDDGIHELGELYSSDAEAPLARRDVDALADYSLVRPVTGGGPSLEAVQASITPPGRTRAAEVRAQQHDRSSRQWACRSALMAWLHDRDASESLTRATGWDEFFVDKRATYLGDRYSADEVDRRPPGSTAATP